MKKGMRLLLQGDAAAALPFLRTAADLEKDDDFQIGAALDVAIALLVMGDNECAEEQLLQLQERTWQGYTIDAHCHYIGLSYWYRHQYSVAVDWFRKAVRAQYARFKGLGTAMLSRFIACRHPELFSLEESFELIESRLPRITPTDPAAMVARFCAEQIDEHECIAALGSRTAAMRKPLRMEFAALAAFYAGVHRASLGDETAFASAARVVTSYANYNSPFEEWVICMCESRESH